MTTLKNVNSLYPYRGVLETPNKNDEDEGPYETERLADERVEESEVNRILEAAEETGKAGRSDGEPFSHIS